MKLVQYIFFGFIFSVCLGNMAIAHDDTQQAENFINSNAQKVLSILKESDNHTKSEQLRRLFLEVVDYEWMAKFVLGRYWLALSPDEKIEYLTAYKNYLSSIYVSKYEEYNKQTYTIFDADDLGDKQYQVSMKINLPTSHTSVKVAYKLLEDGTTFRIIDIIVEGISLITTQRADFSGYLTSHSVQSLIQNLKAKSNLDAS